MENFEQLAHAHTNQQLFNHTPEQVLANLDWLTTPIPVDHWNMQIVLPRVLNSAQSTSTMGQVFAESVCLSRCVVDSD